MLVLSRKPNEAILLEDRGRRIRIVITEVRSGNRLTQGTVRICIDAPPEVLVWREELGPVFCYTPKALRKEPSDGESNGESGTSVSAS